MKGLQYRWGIALLTITFGAQGAWAASIDPIHQYEWDLGQKARERIQVDRFHPVDSNSPSLKSHSKRFLEYKPLDVSDSDFDALRYHVSLKFDARSDIDRKYHGNVQLVFRPVQKDFQVLKLDSAGLKINKVFLVNVWKEVPFAVENNQLLIDLLEPYQADQTLTVSIDYDFDNAFGKGMYFVSRNGVLDVETIYSQSEPEESKYWFPSNSRSNDLATFEATIEVPKPFVALSNGALVNVREEGESRIYHWAQQIPMASYLFVATLGKFGIVRDTWKDIPVEFYGPTDDLKRLEYSLRNTKKVLEFLSNRIGIQYPYEKYAQAVVPQYMWGGMEHTTATTLNDQTLHSPEEDSQFSSDSLVAHEASHQWFGDLATCKNWAHIWLNEGFATYFDGLYQEFDKGKPALQRHLADGARWYFSEEDSKPRPVVFPYYLFSLEDYFDSHAYPKGAWVLHMLRNHLGDETFFHGIRQYIVENQSHVVTTDDLLKAMEKVSKEKLGWFFDQWLYKPGYPIFSVKWNYVFDKKVTEVSVEQVQDRSRDLGVAGRIPLFRGKIGIEVGDQTHWVWLDGESQKQLFTLPTETPPFYVKFNAENIWLAKVRMMQSQEAWNHQLQESKSSVARIEAAEALATGVFENSARVISQRLELVGTCATNDEERWIRNSCAESLVPLVLRLRNNKKLQPNEQEALLEAAEKTALLLTRDREFEIRALGAQLLGQFQTQKAFEALAQLIQNDSKVLVQVEAAKSLGLSAQPKAFEVLVSQLGRTSFQDRLRESLLNALSNFSEPKAFAIGIEHSQQRHDDRVRSGAFDLIAKVGGGLGAPYREEARLALEKALTDPSPQIRGRAVESLGKLRTPASIPALREVALNDSVERVRRAANSVITVLLTVQ